MRRKATKKTGKTISKTVTIEIPSEVNLPRVLAFADYHDIHSFLDTAKKIVPKLKCRELGCVHDYYAIFYTKKDTEYKALVKKTEAEIQAECERLYNS